MTAQIRPSVCSVRRWQAQLAITFALRQGIPRIVENRHVGPLRVLKPFYPESHCCHVYLVHPPGGLVLGDELTIIAKAETGAHALITTPSAGKVYGVDNAQEQQTQHVNLDVAPNACIEWLPQETLVFNGANAVLDIQAHLQGDGKLALWDVVCFGRPASQLNFDSGRCLQSIRIFRDGLPLLIERNLVIGGGELQNSRWGLNGCNSMGTFVLTMITVREQREHLQQQLQQSVNPQCGSWGLTQKGELFIARYLGNSASEGRRGFELLWQALREQFIGKPAIIPRIWAT